MKNWFRKIYLRIWQWAHSKWAAWAIFLCAFADASFLPLPTLFFFVGITLLNLSQGYRYFALATAGTVLGALAGYMVGHFAWLKSSGEFTALALFFIENIPGFTVSTYTTIQTYYAEWDFWILFLASFIPVPYKIFAISSGVFDINLAIFSVATLVSQGIKYYLLALLTIKLGPGVKKILEYNLKPLAFIATAIAAAIFIVIKVF